MAGRVVEVRWECEPPDQAFCFVLREPEVTVGPYGNAVRRAETRYGKFRDGSARCDSADFLGLRKPEIAIRTGRYSRRRVERRERKKRDHPVDSYSAYPGFVNGPERLLREP